MDGGEDLVGSGDGRMRLGSRSGLCRGRLRFFRGWLGVRFTLLLATKVEGNEGSEKEGKGQVTPGRDEVRC